MTNCRHMLQEPNSAESQEIFDAGCYAAYCSLRQLFVQDEAPGRSMASLAMTAISIKSGFQHAALEEVDVEMYACEDFDGEWVVCSSHLALTKPSSMANSLCHDAFLSCQCRN